MEIKIQCNCGTKFKFEFELVNGRVPFEVKCPTCGVDATDTANSYVQQLSGAISTAETVAASSTLAAPSESRLRVRVNTPAPVHVPAPTPGDESPGPAAPKPRFFTPPAVTAYAPPDEGLSPKFFLGLLGGALGVLLGCAIWYLIFHFTGKHYRILALLVGFAGGFGAKLMSKDEGSNQLGMITAVFTLVGIVFTAYFIGRERAHNFVGGLEGESYQEQVAYAKRAIKAVPNGSDQEIRLFLAKEEVYDNEKPDPAGIPASEVRLFRDVRLNHYKELASGKIPEKDFFKTQLRWEYEEEVANAKYALASMPNESNSEIRAYLAQDYADDGEDLDPKSITAEEIQQFRDHELPELKALASGETKFDETMEGYESLDDALTKVENESGWMKFIYFFAGWGLGGLGIIFITLGISFKICTHA